MALALRYADEKIGGDAKVDFIFDECSEFKGARRMLDRMREQPPFSLSHLRRLGICEEENDLRIVALQMADLLAGECSPALNRVETEPYKIINNGNRVLWGDGTPSSHVGGLFRAEWMGYQVERSKKALITWLFKNADFTDEEAEHRVKRLLEMNAIFEEQWARTREKIESDPEVRAFDRMYANTEEPK